jgi:hypothetical protein
MTSVTSLPAMARAPRPPESVLDPQASDTAAPTACEGCLGGGCSRARAGLVILVAIGD